MDKDKTIISGPGRLTKYFGLNLEHNGKDLTTEKRFYILDSKSKDINFTKTPRIGIKKGQDKLWRFVRK